MAQKDGAGLGWLAIGIIALAAIGKCSSGGDVPPEPARLTDTSTSEFKPIMYVSSSTLNCRVEPDAESTVVEKLRRADTLVVGEAQGAWSKVRTLSSASCWVSTRFLAEDAPSTEPPQAEHADRAPSHLVAPEPETARRSRSASGGGYSCGGKTVCRQMNSCAEANYYLNQCGLGRLDRDNDGIPCESIC